jgi:hypothetical protein
MVAGGEHHHLNRIDIEWHNHTSTTSFLGQGKTLAQLI